MATATINVRYLNPRDGQRPPSVKTPEGVYYNLSDEQFPQMQQGGTYNVEYHVKTIRGREYKIVDKVTVVGGAPAARPSSGGRPTDDATAERIFVCGGLNAILSNPNFDLQNLSQSGVVAMVKTLRGAYMETFGGKPSMATELDDEIPDLR